MDAVVREDVRYDTPKPQVFQVAETAVPAGARVVAKGKYSAAEKGLTGTIALTAVSDVTMRQMKNTNRGYIVLGVLIILGATGFSWLLAIFG